MALLYYIPLIIIIKNITFLNTMFSHKEAAKQIVKRKVTMFSHHLLTTQILYQQPQRSFPSIFYSSVSLFASKTIVITIWTLLILQFFSRWRVAATLFIAISKLQSPKATSPFMITMSHNFLTWTPRIAGIIYG